MSKKQAFVLFVLTILLVAAGCKDWLEKGPLAKGVPVTAQVPGGLEQTRDDRSGKPWVLVWKSDQDTLVIDASKDVEADEAETLLRDKKLLMDSLYTRHRAPYPSAVTNIEDCPREFQPVLHEESDAQHRLIGYETSSNDRYVFGGCTGETYSLKAAYVLLYCADTRSFFEIRFFTPRGNPSLEPGAFIQSLACLAQE